MEANRLWRWGPEGWVWYVTKQSNGRIKGTVIWSELETRTMILARKDRSGGGRGASAKKRFRWLISSRGGVRKESDDGFNSAGRHPESSLQLKGGSNSSEVSYIDLHNYAVLMSGSPHHLEKLKTKQLSHSQLSGRQITRASRVTYFRDIPFGVFSLFKTLKNSITKMTWEEPLQKVICKDAVENKMAFTWACDLSTAFNSSCLKVMECIQPSSRFPASQ